MKVVEDLSVEVFAGEEMQSFVEEILAAQMLHEVEAQQTLESAYPSVI